MIGSGLAIIGINLIKILFEENKISDLSIRLRHLCKLKYLC